jgi:hypothetical protein
LAVVNFSSISNNNIRGTRQRSGEGTSRKVAGLSPDEVDFLNGPNPSDRTGPGVDSASNRNEYQESLKKKETLG